MYHSFYYPDDVDVRIPYVAPMNYTVEDERIYSFLGKVGKASDRRKVKRFQKLALKQQERYLPAFREFSDQMGYTYEITGGIEKAYEDGKSKFKKPLSCHLYPIRVTKYDSFHALNYDRWEICLPACELGRKNKLPLYKFLKDPLIRKFGKQWYNKLCNTIENPKEKVVKNL